MESMAEGMIKDLVASGHALADDMTGAPSVLIRCLAAQLEVQLVRANALAAENAYLLNGAARELNTSWMFHKTMLGAQAALVCLSHGYQAAAREWLEGTTDEAGAEIPDDISVGELHEWFDRQMVSNDGKSGFLTRSEAEEAIRKACPATDAFLAEVRAQGVEMFADKYRAQLTALPTTPENIFDAAHVSLRYQIFDADEFAAQLRKGAVL
ncbi:hypothetical protein ACWS92_003065 [Salmonella enterica subsp. enterica serovar Muenchen]